MEKDLEYVEKLAPFMDVVEQSYSPKDQDLWRWCHNPLNERDFIVQAENPINVPNINIDDATREEKLNYIGKHALSAFTSPENAIAAYNKERDGRVVKRGEKAGLKFDEQKGGHIQPIHVTSEQGISSEPSGEYGHVNILTFKGINPMDMATGEPVPVNLDNNSDENAL